MREKISKIVEHAISAAVDAGEINLSSIPDTAIERARDISHGDWATTVALRVAKEAGMSPRAIAEVIVKHIDKSDIIENIEIAGPGFINFRLSPKVFQDIVIQARSEKRDFGKSDMGKGTRVQIEFISANPVGPMHVGHGRWAALGDSMALVMEHAGYDVEREFLLNDVGVQMDIFAHSVAARYLEICGQTVEFPENGYKGSYIKDIAQEIYDDEGPKWADIDAGERDAYFKEKAYAQVLTHLKEVLHDVGVDFDVWFSERNVHALDENGENDITRSIAFLREKGFIYEEDGAVWFRSTAFDDDKDRVLAKSDGTYTYFAADVAYHANKFERGFDLVINIWGADHHGYIARVMAAVAALGYPGQLEIVLGQLVSLYRDGELVRMSKRTGEMITFEELVDEIGVDAARYYFVRRSSDQPLDFDIELAKKNTSENPLYYVQYAHARICSILRKAAQEGSAAADIDVLADALIPADVNVGLLTHEAELALMRKIAELGEVVERAARDRAPFRLTHYAEEMASTFHQFYTQCKVITDDKDVTAARLYLADAARHVLATSLSLIGVHAPTSM